MDASAHITRTVVVAEEQTLLLQAYAAFLPEQEGIALAEPLAQTELTPLLAAVRRHQPQVLIYGTRALSMPHVVTLTALRAVHPGLGVAVLCTSLDPQTAPPLRSLCAGRSAGFAVVLKQALDSIGQLAHLTHTVAAGRMVLDPALVGLVVGQEAPQGELDSLVSRERQVLALMARGLHNGAIAEELGVARQTVERYVHSIYRKLSGCPPQVHRREHAISLYRAYAHAA